MARFYAILEGERGRKSQIGNKFIELELFAGPKDSSKSVAKIRMDDTEGALKLFIKTDNEVRVMEL